MSRPALSIVRNRAGEVKRDVRRLRWFRRAFLEQVASVSGHTRTGYYVDTARLAGAFLTWSREIDRQKPSAEADKRPFVDFAAGLMLRELIVAGPLTARRSGSDDPGAEPHAFWPEGYAYVTFCLNIRDAVLQQTYHETAGTSATFHDLRTWWSFRENVAEDPRLALPFLELFAGISPVWTRPDSFLARREAKPAPVGAGKLRLVWNERQGPTAEGPRDLARGTLDPSVSLVIFDLATLSNYSDIYVTALAGYIQDFGTSINLDETRERFLRAPLNLAMTYVALKTGQVCPSAFISRFRDILAERREQDLQLLPGIQSVLRDLSAASVDIAVLSTGDAEEDAAVLGRLSRLTPGGSASGFGNVLLDDVGGGLLDDRAVTSCVLVSDDPQKLIAARKAGMWTIRLVGAGGPEKPSGAASQDFVIDSFFSFPGPAL